MGYDDFRGAKSFEAKVVLTTKKAKLVEPTIGPPEVWVPNSQILNMGEADIDGNRVFTVTKWWSSKQDWL